MVGTFYVTLDALIRAIAQATAVATLMPTARVVLARSALHVIGRAVMRVELGQVVGREVAGQAAYCEGQDRVSSHMASLLYMGAVCKGVICTYLKALCTVQWSGYARPYNAQRMHCFNSLLHSF